jgi:hypothetical protein
LLNQDYWTINLSGFKARDQNMSLSTNQIIVDSGTSFILMPSQDYQSLQDIFSQDRKCERKVIYNYLLSCEMGYYEYLMNDFPPLVIEMNGKPYEIP